MSKLSFRARQVDYSKPLPIYYNNEIPDLQDFAAINRSVPQMPTGMEKDEEAEHHLQRALSALQVYGTTTSNEYAIPTPNVEIDNKMYERIYNIECPKQKQYIRIQPFSNDFDYPDYDADVEDEDWLNEYKKKLPDDFSDDLFLFFEITMDQLEKAVGFSTNLMSREEAKMMLIKNDNQTEDLTTANDTLHRNKYKTERDEFILCIYEYWKLKRLKSNHPLTPTVLTDKCGVVTAPNNPYLVFRRRTEKMQTRKNRKTEEQSYEKMLILKRDLIRAQCLLKQVKQREVIKKDLVKLTMETFEKRLKSNDYDGTLTDSIKANILKTKSPTVQAILAQTKTNAKLTPLIKHSNIKRESTDAKLIQTVNSKRLKKDKKLSPVNINTIQSAVTSANLSNVARSTLGNLFKTDKNKRSVRRAIGMPSTPAKADSDLCESKTPSPIRSETLSTEEIEYNEELRLNNIENLDSAVTEAKSLFSTNVETDGYWSFKRKEGCKYLAQNGSIFKNDAFDYFSSQKVDDWSSKPTKKELLHQIQRKACGYMVTKKRHLGLMRRRFGRGGRVLLDKINPQSFINQNETANSNESNKFHSLDSLSQFKTYFPVESSEQSVAVVPAHGLSPSDSELDRVYYDHKMYAQTNLTHSSLDWFDLEPLLAINNFDMDEMLEADSDTNSYVSNSNFVKVDFRADFNEAMSHDDEDIVRMVALKTSLKNFIPVKKELVKPEQAEPTSTRHAEDKQIKIEPKLINAFNGPGSPLSTLINKLNEPFMSSSIRPIINGNKYSSTSTSSLPSSSASSSSSSSPLSNTTTTKPNANTNPSSNTSSYLYTSTQSSLTLNGIGSKSNKFEIF